MTTRENHIYILEICLEISSSKEVLRICWMYPEVGIEIGEGDTVCTKYQLFGMREPQTRLLRFSESLGPTLLENLVAYVRSHRVSQNLRLTNQVLALVLLCCRVSCQ